MDKDAQLESQRVRAQIRAGRITGTSRGLAHGFVQCNLAILPKAYAFDFLLYCQRNQRACPVLEVCDPGDPVPRRLAPSADLRTDCARYAIYRDGRREEDRARHRRAVAGRPRRLPDRIGHQHRCRARGRGRADPQGPLGSAHGVADRAGGAVSRRHDRDDALADAGPGNHRDASHGAVSIQSRGTDPHRRSRQRSAPTWPRRCLDRRCRRRRRASCRRSGRAE